MQGFTPPPKATPKADSGAASAREQTSPTRGREKGGISYIAALQMAEEREARLRKSFKRFDLDNSGTIDMDELLVLLDDIGLWAKLRSDPEDFVRDVFTKYDANSDGVLNFTEFINVHNAALDDVRGRTTATKAAKANAASPPTSPKKGAASTAEARKKLAMERAAKKAQEAARIHKQNAEMRARILAMGKGKDPKAVEAEIEQRRRAMAKARAEAKAEEQALLEQEKRALMGQPLLINKSDKAAASEYVPFASKAHKEEVVETAALGATKPAFDISDATPSKVNAGRERMMSSVDS